MSAAQKTSNEKRRRLIKSAAAAPVVFTLPSGAALAASSAMCDVKSGVAFVAEPKPAVTAGADRWMRAELQAYTFKGKIAGVNGATDYPGFKFSDIKYAVVNGSAVALSNVTKETELTGQFYYVLVDYRGDQSPGVILNSASLGDALPIAGASCWNSLTGDTASSNVISIP